MLKPRLLGDALWGIGKKCWIAIPCSPAALQPCSPAAAGAVRARALQMHLHAGQHLLGLDGLSDVVQAARPQRGNQVFGLGQPGHEDDGDVGSGRQGLQPATMPRLHASTSSATVETTLSQSPILV